MKGFKPTGYGPSAGFKFPVSMGFTGSTGGITNVSPYVRRKGYANGGFVREDNPRMKTEVIGDQGSALVRRRKATTAEDQEAGGKSPLRAGYRTGGRVEKRIMKSPGALGAVLRTPPPGMMGKIMRKADGGRIPRYSSKKGFMASLRDVPKLVGELPRLARDALMSQKIGSDPERIISRRQREIDRATDMAVTGRSNYRKGGKAARMGYAAGGGVSIEQAKKIAERTVGEHVRYPAPKGHKGFKKP